MAVTITAAMVGELKNKTGAGLMDCKRALVETNGDQDAAIVILREKGLATAAKKESRIAADGIVKIMNCGDVYAMKYSNYNIKHSDDKTYCNHCFRKIFYSGKNHPQWNENITIDEREHRRKIPGYNIFTRKV